MAREERQQTLVKGLEAWDMAKGVMFKATATGFAGWNHNSGNHNSPMTSAEHSVRLRCSHCRKLGHEKENCYELVGYPPNWGSRRTPRVNSTRNRGNPRLSGSIGGQREPGADGQHNKVKGFGGTKWQGGEAFLAAERVQMMLGEKDGLTARFDGLTLAQLEEVYAYFKEKESQKRITGKSNWQISSQKHSDNVSFTICSAS